MKIRIYYDDTDSGGVVYYANYLRFCERSRTEYLRERGINVANYAENGTIFVVAHVDVSYRSPARYNDLLDIETRITGYSRTSYTFFHRIIDSETGRLVVEAAIKLVCVNEKGRPDKLPARVRRVVEEAAGRAVELRRDEQ